MSALINNIIKTTMNFSIIIPHKNIPDLLDRCLNSIPIRNDLEIIIVDDNSDTSIIDLKKFPGLTRPDVSIIFNTNGLGGGAARNIGINASKGKWLLFADADDTYTDSLNEFLDKHIDSPSDIVYFKANVISSNGRKISNMNMYIDAYLNGTGNLDDIMYGAWEPWNKLIKRSIIIDNNISYDEISSSNDKMFSLYLARCVSNIEVSDKILYNYILREGSVSHSHKSNRFENSFNTIIRQNSLYHQVGYKRKIFMPLFFIKNAKYIKFSTILKYWEYIKEYRANPFEGFITYLLFHFFKRL